MHLTKTTIALFMDVDLCTKFESTLLCNYSSTLYKCIIMMMKNIFCSPPSYCTVHMCMFDVEANYECMHSAPDSSEMKIESERYFRSSTYYSIFNN